MDDRAMTEAAVADKEIASVSSAEVTRTHLRLDPTLVSAVRA